jgi:ribosomal protein S12 methylthiotransferase
MKRNTINIVTLGCSKNLVDSQKLMRQLEAGGYIVKADYEGAADIVIINTCGFILDAKEESINTIMSHAEAIRKRGHGKLFVMGCLAERYHDELVAEMPEVDAWFGVNNPSEIVSKLGKVYHSELTGERVLPGQNHYAYLKIAEGCDRTCAFCAIPGIRGPYHSVPMEELEAEASFLASRGVKELILIAQDLSYYGLDIYGKQSLCELTERLSKTEGIDWIRLHYLYPANFPMEIIDLMLRNEKICRYIDIPIQHISDSVLKKMRRSHNMKETISLLHEIRSKIPDAAIRTTVIAGHPGETEKDFNELLDFIKEFRFDRLGAFSYSHEEDTYGYVHYADDVPDRTKEKRVELIMNAQQEISAELNETAVGKVMKVIIDRREGVFYIGRSMHDSPEVDQEILVTSSEKIEPGTFINVKITGSNEYDLYAEAI